MPGTGDLTYVLGPSLVAVVLGLLIVVMKRALRRGPAVTPRSAPDHGLLRPASDMPAAGDLRPHITAHRSGLARGTAPGGAELPRQVVRPSTAERARAVARRGVLSRG